MRDKTQKKSLDNTGSNSTIYIRLKANHRSTIKNAVDELRDELRYGAYQGVLIDIEPVLDNKSYNALIHLMGSELNERKHKEALEKHRYIDEVVEFE